jgi:predicted DCC family thiol-disulfide oxidoreductase YuxK
MTTEVRNAEKFLAYDGDCPMCIATVGLLVRWGLVRQEQTRSNHDLDEADAEQARQAGIRNQLVVFEPNTRQTRVGSDGLLWIIGETAGYHYQARLLGLPGLKQLVSFGYKAISYNRRIISPPAHQIVCDCEPEVTVGRRLSLVVPLLVLGMAIVAGFGASAFVGCQVGDAAHGALLMSVASGVGWLILSAVGLAVLGGMRGLDYLSHLAVTLFAGALILLPGAVLLAWLPRPAAVAITALSLMFCVSTMFKMQVRRVKAMRLGLGWLMLWGVVLTGTFLLIVAGYFRDGLR